MSSSVRYLSEESKAVSGGGEEEIAPPDGFMGGGGTPPPEILRQKMLSFDKKKCSQFEEKNVLSLINRMNRFKLFEGIAMLIKSSVRLENMFLELVKNRSKFYICTYI